MRLRWCCPPGLLAHLFPHSVGLVVWTSEWSSLKQVSLLPVWLSEGVFSPYAMTLLCQLHCLRHWGLFMFCHFIHHYKSSLDSLRSKCEEACQDVFGAWLKNVSHWRSFFIEISVTVWSDTNNTVVRSWLQSAYILQSSEVVSSISPVEFVSITLCVYAHVGASWDHPCEWRGSLTFVGSGDQRTWSVTWVTVLLFFLFSSFFPLPVSGRKVGLEERKDWKLLNVDYTECCGAYWREKSTSAGSQGSHTVILQCSPPSACLSLERRPVLSLWMSRRQTCTVSGLLWYWLILPGRTRQLVDKWEGHSALGNNKV